MIVDVEIKLNFAPAHNGQFCASKCQLFPIKTLEAKFIPPERCWTIPI